MPSVSDLERALSELGSDEWFFPQVGIVDNSYQARLWKEPFAVHVGDKFSDVGLVWRGDVDVTAEMSFGGATPMDWLGGINATHAEISKSASGKPALIHWKTSGFYRSPQPTASLMKAPTGTSTQRRANWANWSRLMRMNFYPYSGSVSAKPHPPSKLPDHLLAFATWPPA
jgi:hypothetical protein